MQNLNLILQARSIFNFDYRPDANFEGNLFEIDTKIYPDMPEGKQLLKIDLTRCLVLIYSQFKHERVSANNHTQLLRFLARVNERIEYGNFELNFNEKLFRYKTSQSFPGVRDASPAIAYMANLHEKYIKLFYSVDIDQLTDESSFNRTLDHILSADNS